MAKTHMAKGQGPNAVKTSVAKKRMSYDVTVGKKQRALSLERRRQSGKIRIGVLYGKGYDPIKVGTHDRKYPKKLRLKDNTGPKAKYGWGGQFQIDVSTGLKVAKLHPDIFTVDFIPSDKVTPKRLKKNHINYTFCHDPIAARMERGINSQHVRNVDACFKDPNCRLWPNWDCVQWIAHKPIYIKACQKVGIPTIPTIVIENGFHPKEVLDKVRAKGWVKFHCKVGSNTMFGCGSINGKVQDFLDKPSLLEEFAKENKDHKCFLVQPCMLKPNGEVFDEIRNYFVNGVWQTSIFTHGTDETAAGYYEQPAGKLKDAVFELSQRAYDLQKKSSVKWNGKRIDTFLTRVDIGVMPDKSTPLGYNIFVNEIEFETCTWLARYWPKDMANVTGPAMASMTRDLLKRLIETGRKLPHKEAVRKNLEVLDERLTGA